MPTTRIRATPTPTQKTRASALARTLDPVSGEEFLPEPRGQSPRAAPREGRGRRAAPRPPAPGRGGGVPREDVEQKPLVVPREEQGRFDDLLSVADVERLLTSG